MIGSSGIKARALLGCLRLRAGAASKAPKGSSKKSEDSSGPSVSKEIRETVVVGANIYKDGVDPPIKDDSEYPEWLWHLLDKKAPLSELQRKKHEDMDMGELTRMLKLSTRKTIKENNISKAKV